MEFWGGILRWAGVHYNHERPHAGLGRRMIKPRQQDADGEIVCTERLGGLLKYYHRVQRAA
jgi:hypothetical protein